MSEKSTPAKPHVVMMVANDISNDARVIKEAVALAQTDVRVTLLGVAPAGSAANLDSLDHRVVMMRLQGAFPLRDDRTRRRKQRRARRLPLVGYRLTSDSVVQQIRIDSQLADLKAESGRAAADRKAGSAGALGYKLGVVGRGLRQRRLRLGQQSITVRKGLTRRQNKLFASGWKTWDDLQAKTERPVNWRKVVPEAYDYEKIFGSVLDELAPDVLHAHDMHLIGVATRAAGRASLRGRKMKVVYDAHEYVPGLSRYHPRTPRFIAAWAQHEREYIRDADRVITVSPAIARRLQSEHRLDREPTVIINTPSQFEGTADVRDLRSQVGLADEVPLLVYSGGVTRARGVETAVQALPLLPDVHLAVVCVPTTKMRPVDELRTLAESLGVEDRVHYVEPVGPDEVTSFLRTADIGLIPILRFPSHEMALPNKVFEYIFAGLPVVTSNMPSLTEFVNETKIGEVFEVENPTDLAAKVSRILADPAPYRERASDAELRREVSWEGQADQLRNLYADLIGKELPVDAAQPVARQVFIGPANTAGQAGQWAKAIQRNNPDISAVSMRIEAGLQDFPADWTVKRERYKSSAAWRAETADYLLRNVSHVLFESGRPILGQSSDAWFGNDQPVLDSADIKHGVIFHGPEVRDPRRHSEIYPHSPFTNREDKATAQLQVAVDLMQAHLKDYTGPRFVATPDLLEFVEDSVWLPAVVELDDDAPTQPVLERDKPVVLHALSRSALKGTDGIDAVLTELQSKGLIEYQRVEGVSHAELTKLVRDADIVVDQLLLGAYSAFAVEAMAAGRITVGHVAKHVRELLPLELPIVEATPDTLGDIIEQLVSQRGPARAAAAAGPQYVRELHDGRKSAEVLSTFLK